MQYLENLTNTTSLDVIIDITPHSKPKIIVSELEFLSFVWGTCNSFAMIFSLKHVWGTCNLLSLKRNSSCKWQFGQNPTTISFNKKVKCVKSKDLIMYFLNKEDCRLITTATLLDSPKVYFTMKINCWRNIIYIACQESLCWLLRCLNV